MFPYDGTELLIRPIRVAYCTCLFQLTIKQNVWGNYAFDDASMEFGTLSEYVMKNIFVRRAIT